MPDQLSMTKAEAAAFLGKSLRTIAEYVQSGKLRAEYVTGKHGRQPMFALADLEQFKRDAEQPEVRAVPAPASNDTDSHPDAGEMVLSRSEARQLSAIAVVVAMVLRDTPQQQPQLIPPPSPAEPVKQFYTIAEAAVFLSIPEGLVRLFIRKKRLLVTEFGRKREVYIHRRDLTGLDPVSPEERLRL